MSLESLRYENLRPRFHHIINSHFRTDVSDVTSDLKFLIFFENYIEHTIVNLKKSFKQLFDQIDDNISKL